MVNSALFPLYAASAPKIIDTWTRQANTILVESGIPVAFIRRIRRNNPTARIVYVASDDVATIGSDDFIKKELSRIGGLLSAARVTSPLLFDSMPKGCDSFFVPHGIDFSLKEKVKRNPFAPGSKNAVAVGSMLYDPSVFEIAGKLLPETTFHAIGTGYSGGSALPNVIYYPEMPFRDTLDFIAHADVGAAPYGEAKAPYYLTDTSMKLIQYEFFGLNAVCPSFIADGKPGRFGYQAGDAASIQAAFRSALDTPRVDQRTRKIFQWTEVVDRLLDPQSFPDTYLTRN